MSSHWAVPRTWGWLGFKPRERCASISGARSSMTFLKMGFGYAWIFMISCEVRKPSKAWTKGTRERSVAMCAARAKSKVSCTVFAKRIAKPVDLTCMTSFWSPKMLKAWEAMARAGMWNTQGVSSPAILHMFGSINSKPWEAVYVVARPPVESTPCTAPAAPASDCICCTFGTWSKALVILPAIHVSAISAMSVDGVMGKMHWQSVHW
mmetsp:Transcript_67073/g.194152  ORF Transcript_67073/g.194152 Transcript_67073/m.194152 type:complete len:208 (-) Transcript_67073:332-955(-)